MTTESLSGAFVHSVELTRELSARGHQVTLVVLGRPPSQEQARTLQGIPGLTIEELPDARVWTEPPWQDVEAVEAALQRVAERVQPDCIHLNELTHAALSWSAPVVVVGHACVQSWWRAVQREASPAKYDHYRHKVRAGLARASCVVAPSSAQLRELARYYGPLPRARAIASGIDLSAFKPQPKQPMIVSAGRLRDRAKNIALLQQVAPQLSWPVFLAGETEGSENGQSSLGADACRPLGPLTRAELADMLARAAIYAAPARYEPFGLSILEAAASGCALVLGRIPSLVEHWTGAACFVDPHDPSELAHTLKTLTADPKRCEQWGQQALQRSRAFGASRMAAAYDHLYGEIVRVHSNVSRAS